ncbi:MFS transporter [Sphaerisporangium sp. B11E5]|uniref:MFS transporter n=1 Tax=Sphaerisporangium sp. B11E5 TaxID=3153563 RepID=UPI00325D6E11
MSSADGTTGTSGGTGGASRGLWTLLAHNADFRRLFTGTSVSLLGSSVTTVALPLTGVIHLRASAAEMGLLSAAALLPHLVLGLPAGVWVSRVPYRRVLVLTDLTQMASLAAIPVLAVLGSLQMWHLYAVALSTGVAALFSTVAAQSFTPDLVPRDRLLAANSGLMLSNATVTTTGSALGGMLVSALTAPVAIVVDAASFLVSALCKARIRAPGHPAVPTTPPRLKADIVEGWRAVFAHPVMRAVVTAATIGAFAGQMKAVVLALYLIRDIDLSAAQVGLLIALSGAAAVAGALTAPFLTERLGPGPAFVSGMFLTSVSGLVLATASGPFPVAFTVVALAQCLAGAGPSLYGVNQQTFRQVFYPAGLLPRVNATWRFLAFGSQSIGALTGGLTATALDLRAALLVSSCLMLTGTAMAAASPLRRLRRLP